MNNVLNDYVKALDNLKIYDTDHQYEFQQAYLPAVNSFRLKCVSSYKYKGNIIRYNPNKIYLLADLPVTDKCKREAKTMTLLETIDKKFIKPFILFQDKKYLSWDHVNVVFDWNGYYLIIDNNGSTEFDTITFPYDIIINDYSTIFDINDKTLFMFNKDGYYINYGRFKRHLSNKAAFNNKSNLGLNSEWPEFIDSNKLEPGGTVDGEQSDLWANTIKKAYSSFPDGSEIEDDSIYNHPGDAYIMVSMRNSNEKLLHFTGRYTNWYSNMSISDLDREYLIGPKNFICFDKDGKLAIDSVEVDCFNEFKLKEIGMYFDMFYYTFNNKSLNNSLRVKNLYVQKTAEKLCPNLPLIKDPLDIKFNREKTYEDNILDNQDKLYYNPEIISNVNDKHTPINTIDLKGSDLLKARRNDGCVHLLRNNDKDNITEDCFVMIFVNGELIKDNYQIRYDHNSIIVPVNSIKNDDNIEVVYFHHIDNRTFDINLGENGYSLNDLSEDININDIELYSKDSPNGFLYNIKNKPHVYIEVEYNIKDNTINPINDYYNNRPVIMTSSKQFHCHSYYANGIGLRVELPGKFDFCNKKENYLVFINGRKQNDFHFTEMTDTRPFYNKAIYLHKMYNRGDIIDIFYIPYKSDIIDVDIDKHGNIISDEDLYFSKNVSLLFINGKKVRHSEIAQIPMEGLRVIKDYKSMKNISLIKLEGPSYNKRYYSELWDAVSSLPESIRDELLWLPLLGDTPENDTIHIKREMGIRDEGFDNASVGAVFASMINKIEKHRSILMTGRMLNGLEMKIVERSKNTIDDIENDMCSDELSPAQVIYEIIKDYYTAPNIMNDNNIYSNKFFYDYDSRILDFDDKVLDPDNSTDIFIIRLLSAYKFDKAPQSNLIK